MSAQYWETLANAGTTSATTTGAAYASSTTITDVSPGANTAGQAFTVPASGIIPGQMWRFYADGIYSTTGTPTLLIGFYYGGVAGTALCATAATTTGTGVANGIWTATATMRVITAGTSGTAVTVGSVLGIGATTGTAVLMPATSATGGQVTIDTSVSKIITVGATWGTNSASNTLTCFKFAAELLN